MKILWCITGAGEFLRESLEAMSKADAEITVFASNAGEEVLRAYGLFREVKKVWKVQTDKGYSAKSAGKVTLGEYDVVVVSPATSNTVAKVANGVSDNLVTTAVSLALKTGVPVYMVPTDWIAGKKKIPDILTPGGSLVHMRPRKADLRNIKYLEAEGVAMLEGPERILRELK